MEISVPVPCIFLSLNFGSINRDEYLNSLPFGVLNKPTSVTHPKGGNKCKEKVESTKKWCDTSKELNHFIEADRQLPWIVNGRLLTWLNTKTNWHKLRMTWSDDTRPVVYVPSATLTAGFILHQSLS
jgi:hypothetical protein